MLLFGYCVTLSQNIGENLRFIIAIHYLTLKSDIRQLIHGYLTFLLYSIRYLYE